MPDLHVIHVGFVAAAFLALCAASCSGQSIALFGDSLSDNGNGYAANAKFVLQTSEVYPEVRPVKVLAVLMPDGDGC